MSTRATRFTHATAWLAMLMIVLAVVVGAGAPPSFAVDLHGSLRIPDAYAHLYDHPSQRPRFYWEEWNGALDPRPPRPDVARAFAVVLTGGTTAPTVPPIVRFSGGTLLPSTIVVRAGAVLRIENRDDFAHELFAENLQGFSAEATSSQAARIVTVGNPGHYKLHDHAVAHVEGDLYVIADLAAVATLDADGRFTFAGVGAGQYTLKVFAGPNLVISQPLQVAEGREVTLDPMLVPAPAVGH